ncbi:MAG: hypothetical protein AMS18_04655 [Gemmatimonas sp. SG8_17]|nr:MAG: hypothetical protein AMS18_04655 [Gemmatimonas sp. SG8_17]
MRLISLAAGCWFLSTACGGGAQFGTVEFGELAVEGRVDADFLSLQLNQLDPRFEACYVKALRGNRSAQGTIALRLRGGGGHLRPEVSFNDTGSPDLAECVIEATSGLTIIERQGYEPWDFSGSWSVEFKIVRRDNS